MTRSCSAHTGSRRRRVARHEGYEFYVRLVPVLRFTTALWRLPVDHPMRMIGPKGRFMLEPKDDRTHLFVSTGTGIAPVHLDDAHTADQGRPRARWSCSTAPRTSGTWATSSCSRTGGATAISADIRADDLAPDRPANAGWEGRTGRVEGVVLDVCKDLDLRPEKTVVYICGNPDMILNVERAADDAGFPEFHVKKELYWPKGKTVPVPQAAQAGA